MPTAFIPASGGKQIVPGCSDKTPRSLFTEQAASSAVVRTGSRCAINQHQRKSHPESIPISSSLPTDALTTLPIALPADAVQKLTTASRASAALEQYWQQQQGSSIGSSAGNSNHSTGSTSAGHAKKQQDHLPGGERELAHKTRDTCEHEHWCTYHALPLHMMHVEPQLMMRLRHRHMQRHSKPLRACCLLPVPAACACCLCLLLASTNFPIHQAWMPVHTLGCTTLY